MNHVDGLLGDDVEGGNGLETGLEGAPRNDQVREWEEILTFERVLLPASARSFNSSPREI